MAVTYTNQHSTTSEFWQRDYYHAMQTWLPISHSRTRLD